MANDTAKIQAPSRIGAGKADRILKFYVQDVQGLTEQECLKTGLEQKQCEVLVKTLGKGVEGEITAEERTQLEQAGFAQSFIGRIAGVDGKKALRRRTSYFAPRVQRCLALLKRNSGTFDRYYAETTLNMIGDLAVPGLIAALRNTDWEIRNNAVGWLGKIGNPSTVPDLIVTLKNLDSFVRGSAAWALQQIIGKSGPNAFIPYLRDLERMAEGKDPDCNADCQEAASHVLQKLEEEMR